MADNDGSADPAHSAGSVDSARPAHSAGSAGRAPVPSGEVRTGAAIAAPEAAPPGPFTRGTLGRRLLIRVVLIVAAVAIFLSCASVLATQQVMLRNTDQELRSVVDRVWGGPDPQPGGNLLQPGVPPGALFAVYLPGDAAPAGGGVLTFSKGSGKLAGQRSELPDGVGDRLAEVQPTRKAHTVRLPGLGRYRVVGLPAIVDDTGQPVRLVVGIPMTDADAVLTSAVLAASVLSGLAILAAVIAVASVVRRSLRPLNRVAATAQQVSRLQLDRGEVELAMRVPTGDTDPVSEVGRVGQALNHLLDNVDGALAARQASETKLKQFIADASHELRNPLASIRGYAELTRRDRDQLPPDTAYALGRVESEATRMSHLVEDLLLLARLDSGPNIEVGEVDLAELLINAVSDARAAGADHQWILELDQPAADSGDSMIIIGDRYRLHQAVVNLLANARTHTPAGTTVRAGLRATDRAVMITIADNGPGIPESIRGRVFERFTRADASRARTTDGGGSTGLGLAIVAAVVEAHQGRVEVASTAGDTRFTIQLPKAPSAP